MTQLNRQDIGPLQLLAVGFSNPKFKGRISDELTKLRKEKLVRIVDGIVVQKTKAGEIAALETSDLTAKENREYGAVIGNLLGLGAGDEDTARELSDYIGEDFNRRYEYGLDSQDVEDLAKELPAGGAVLILLIEHKWLIPLRGAMRDAGGYLLAQDFLSPELLMSVGKEMAAT